LDYFSGYDPDLKPFSPILSSETTISGSVVTPVMAPDHTLREDAVIGLLRGAVDSVLVEQLQCSLRWGGELLNLYLEECIEAARRGCHVRILLDSRYVNGNDGKEDNIDTVNYINTLAYAEELDNLEARLIYLGNLSKLHNKGVVVDSRTVLVSSINWGPGAVLHNREVGLIVENAEIAAYFTRVFEFDWKMGPVSNGDGNRDEDEADQKDRGGENSPGFCFPMVLLAAAIALLLREKEAGKPGEKLQINRKEFRIKDR